METKQEMMVRRSELTRVGGRTVDVNRLVETLAETFGEILDRGVPKRVDEMAVVELVQGRRWRSKIHLVAVVAAEVLNDPEMYLRDSDPDPAEVGF